MSKQTETSGEMRYDLEVTCQLEAAYLSLIQRINEATTGLELSDILEQSIQTLNAHEDLHGDVLTAYDMRRRALKAADK